MVRFFGKPSEEDILLIKDRRDEYYLAAMKHASIMVGFKDE